MGDVIIVHINFRCGKRFDIRRADCGNNIFNYTVDGSVDCSSNGVIVRSQHETSLSTKKFNTRESKQVQTNSGNCTCCTTVPTTTSICKHDADSASKEIQMTDNRFPAMAPLAQRESLTDTSTVRSEDNEVVAISTEVGGSNLCWCCRLPSQPGTTSLTDDNRQFPFPEKPQYHEKTVQSLVTAANTATAIATHYVGDSVQKHPTEMKKSRINRFLDLTAKKNDKTENLEIEVEPGITSDSSGYLEGQNPIKSSKRRDIFRRLRGQDKDESSFLKAPSVQDGRQQDPNIETSNVSNATALSLDCVQIIETEYSNFQMSNIYSSYDIDDDDEVSLNRVYVIDIEKVCRGKATNN